MKLNSTQKEAVEHGNGPLLIVAGAGTGKTTVISERVKWLTTVGGIPPSQILALTFTEKAAREMEERIDKVLPLGYSQLWTSTFHSFCDRILKDEAVHIGLDSNFKLMSEAETILFLRDHLFKIKLDYFRPSTNPDKFLGALIDHFSRLQDEDITPDQYLAFSKKMAGKNNTKEEVLEAEKTAELANAFVVYQKLKEHNGVFSFADLISYTLKLFRERSNVLEEYRKKFNFVLVDEFQDTNIAQYEIVKLLAPVETNPNLTVTGDDSQSIYKFRGAAISNILTLKEDYKNIKTIVLTENYRSTQTILNHTYQLIKYNDPDTLEVKLGISKNLVSQRKTAEKPIGLIFADRVENEADAVAAEIKKLAGKYQFKDFAILVRANNHAEPFTRALSQRNIPFQFLGPGKLFRKPEIKDLIAYLQLLVNPQDNIAFFKVASMPIFDISARDLALIRGKAKRENLSFFEAAEQTPNSQMEKLIKMYHRHLKLLSKESGGQILYYFLEDSGLLKSLMNPKKEIDQQKALNISKFFEKIKSFESGVDEKSVFHLIDWITLRLELGESPLAAETDWNEVDAVNILTVHSAKGLEFPVVFIVNLVDRRFPTTRRREEIPIPQPLIKEFLPAGDPHEQEERRLFYVAATRAKDLLYFSAAKYYGEGKIEKKLSPFVAEALGEKKLKKAIEETINNGQKHQLSLLGWQKNESEKAPIVNLPLTYLSFSQIDAFNICPLQYKYKYIIRLPTPPSAPQTTGITIHRTLKEFYQKQIAETKKLSFESMLKIFDQNWQSAGFKSKLHEKETEKSSKEMLKMFYQNEIEGKPFPKIAALEQPFSFPLTNSLKLGGVIDRVDILSEGKIEIIDYKTGERVPDQKAVDHNDQLTLYALAASTITDFSFLKPLDKITISLYFLKEGIKLSSQRTKKQIDEFKEKIIKLSKDIKKSEFIPTPGSPFPCDYCEYKLLCDAW